MMNTTVCFLLNKDRVCLAMKKRGFGTGKWNGAGGKVEDKESVEEGTVREVWEEIGVKVSQKDLKEVGKIDFYFPENPDWDQHMYIFFANNWDGTPRESEEMLPKWFNKNNLPLEDMWVGDRHWLPVVLEGKKIEADFYFKGKGEELDKYEIREI